MAAAGSAASSSLLRVSVTGDAGTGKSSVIKRIVSHRFDNVPTRNAEFMGTRSNGVHVSLLYMPSISGSLAGRRKGTGPSQVLLEMQDQLPHVSSEQILAEEPWYNVSDEKVDAAPEKSSLFGGGAKLFANAAMSASKAAKGSSSQLSADADEGDDEGRPGPHREDWARNRQDPVGMRKSAPQEPGPHPLMDHQFAGRAKETVKEVLPGSAGTSPLMTPHGTHGWIVVSDLGSRASFERAQLQINVLLDKVGFSPEGKVACPVAIVLVGNKYDRYSGKRMAVRHQQIWEFLATSATPGAIAGQATKPAASNSHPHPRRSPLTVHRSRTSHLSRLAARRSPLAPCRKATSPSPSPTPSPHLVTCELRHLPSTLSPAGSHTSPPPCDLPASKAARRQAAAEDVRGYHQ